MVRRLPVIFQFTHKRGCVTIIGVIAYQVNVRHYVPLRGRLN
jgi:hypothetical protein